MKLSIIRRAQDRWCGGGEPRSRSQIAEIAFTSPDRVREVIHNFNADRFDSLAPKSAGGRPPTFTLPQRQQVKKIALARPTDHGLPFSTWSLSKLAEFLVAEGVVDDISPEGLRGLLREEGVSFHVIKTWKQSNDPLFEEKKNRILELYAIADDTVEPSDGDPTVVICVDEFGPLNLQPHPGKQWASVAAGKGDLGSPRRRRMRATYNRPHGVRHMMGTYDLATDRLYGHVVVRKDRTAFIRFLRYVRSMHQPEVRIAIVLDNFSPHLSTKKDQRVGEWAAANNVELACTPTNSSWLNRIEAQFQALRYFSLDGTDHGSHAEQASMIGRHPLRLPGNDVRPGISIQFATPSGGPGQTQHAAPRRRSLRGHKGLSDQTPYAGVAASHLRQRNRLPQVDASSRLQSRRPQPTSRPKAQHAHPNLAGDSPDTDRAHADLAFVVLTSPDAPATSWPDAPVHNTTGLTLDRTDGHLSTTDQNHTHPAADNSAEPALRAPAGVP